MNLKAFLSSASFIAIAVGFFFVPNQVDAQSCQDVGGACRPGWISGCAGGGENPIPNTCLANASGFLVCCQAPQDVNDCTNAGGICRGSLYATWWPSEPACGYDSGDVVSSDACSAPNQICCVPPPNIGAPCGSGAGVCQLPTSCDGGGNADSACFGGAVCCRPLLGSFTVSSCVIPIGQSTCDTTVSWSVLNPITPTVTHDGTVFSIAASSPGELRTLTFGLNIFELADGPTTLSTRPASATCQSGSSWDGSTCALPAPVIGSACQSADSGNMGTCGFSCTPPAVAETVDSTYVPATCGGGSTYCCVTYGPGPSATLNVPLGCDIPVGQSTCDVTISWNIPSPVSPRIEQDGGLISLAPSSPGTVITLNYGTASLIDMINNGSIIDTAASQANCSLGTSWDGSKCASTSTSCTGATSGNSGSCVNPSSCTGTAEVDTSGTCDPTEVCCTPSSGPGPSSCTGSCVPVGFGCSGSQVPDPTGTCSSGQMCCVDSAPGPGPAACTGSCVPIGFGCTAPQVPDPTGVCSSGQMCCVAGGGPGPGPVIPPTPLPPTFGYPNPLADSDLNTFVAKFLVELQKLIATLAIIFIVIGAFLYITSAGDSGRIETAKKCILGALIGLALGVVAPMFFREIGTLLGWTGLGGASAVIPAGPSLLTMAMNVVNFLLSIIGVIAIIMLVVGAFMYLTAAGDESRIDTGKSIVKYSLIGITVALSALVLVRMVVNFF